MTQNDISILEYVGGYILCKLKKKARFPRTRDNNSATLCKFFATSCNFGTTPFLKKYSLIETLTNEGSRGSLTVAIPAFVNVFVYLEQVFRADVDEQNCFSKIKSNIDIDCVEDLLMPLHISEDCL